MRMRLDDCRGLHWHDPAAPPFRITGLAWFNSEGIYRRLPRAPGHPLPASVDGLADCSAGGQVRFRTDSRRVAVRVELGAASTMTNMAAAGESGFDCYISPVGQEPRFYAAAKFDRLLAAYEAALFEHPIQSMREVVLNLPLYARVRSLRVGVEPDANIASPASFRLQRPLAIYGTSITQGSCASRPGMAYPNILGRILDAEVLNLGFSGSGRGEPEVARVLAEIPPPALWCLDYEANVKSIEEWEQTLPTFVEILRGAHPFVPILVLTKIPYPAERCVVSLRHYRERRGQFARDLVIALRRRGDRRIHFYDGGRLLGHDFEECTVDGVHPNDLGFYRMAKRLAPAIRRILR